jgi:Xaa-Pro dipeptidase
LDRVAQQVKLRTMLSPKHCRSRQKRLLALLQKERLDAIVVALPHHVYYFTGYLPQRAHHGAFILLADGRTWLTCANKPPENAAADAVVTYEADWMATHRQEQAEVVAEQVVATLNARRAARVGVDASPVASQVTLEFDGACAAIDPGLWQMRRVKDPDELELMKRSIRCTEAMYRRARQIVEPGIPEIQVYNELCAAAVQSAGELLSGPVGNDFACGEPGGPPRKERVAKAGEIYILDLGAPVGGYASDNCRAIAVDRKPTDAQNRAWRTLAEIFPIVERLARPGVRCRDLFVAANEHLRAAGYPALVHHLGHGVGLQGHEYPHLNPRWDDVLMEGEVFTAEPGIYLPDLAGGIRLENQYLVQAKGVENLTPFPMELVDAGNGR